MREPLTPLAKRRRERGFTQKRLSGEVFVAKLTYERYEHGLTEPAVGTAIRIADVLGVKTYGEFRTLFGAATQNNAIK